MRIDWANDRNAPRCRVIDLDTGQQLTFCVTADEETGEFERYDHDMATGTFQFNEAGEVRRVKGTARLEIVPLTAEESYLLSKGETKECAH